MKAEIHPTYVECKVSCVCGNSFETKSALPEIKIEVAVTGCTTSSGWTYAGPALYVESEETESYTSEDG